MFVTSLAKTDWKKVLNAVAMDSGSVNLSFEEIICVMQGFPLDRYGQNLCGLLCINDGRVVS